MERYGVNLKEGDKPAATLDINGAIKLGYEDVNYEKYGGDCSKTAGIIRWNKAKECFEGHGINRWACISDNRFDVAPLLNLKWKKGEGGEKDGNLIGSTDWNNGVVVPLEAKEDADKEKTNLI